MKRITAYLILCLTLLTAYGESVEHGSVKEYRGSDTKTPLPGVELNVKGAQSTVSDRNGNFALRFAILDPGQKVDYTDIYKEGYVIFNKDAIEAWRISNDGTPFLIIMCKESDFRALKKKFYGIIERSYLADYQRQKEIAERTIEDKNKLETQLKHLKEEYEAKMGNINTYVELFSRIDRSEMDSIEARALEHVENGKIDEAIRLYEALRLDRQIDSQMSKWDSGEDMRAAADKMIGQAQSDLVILADKMQKQIGLYEMGGADYRDKRLEMIGKLIPLLYRLNPASNYRYNEDIGRLIVERAKGKPWSERLDDYREAAAVPSAHGCLALAERYSFLLIHDRGLQDSIAYYNGRGLELAQEGDSLYKKLTVQAAYIPDGIYIASDGKRYPFKRIGEKEAALCGYSYYVSTTADGTVTLPSEVTDGATKRKVVAIIDHAFGDNAELRTVELPKGLQTVGKRAFIHCPVETFYAPGTLSDFPVGDNLSAEFVFSEAPGTADWLWARADTLCTKWYMKAGYGKAMLSTLKAIREYADKHKNKALTAAVCNKAAYVHAMDEYGIHDYPTARKLLNEGIKCAKGNDMMLANLYDSMGEVYLMEGDSTEARAWHDKSAATVEGFYEKTTSQLHKALYPTPIPAYEENATLADSVMRKCTAIALAAAEYAAARVPDGLNISPKDMRWYALAWVEDMNNYTPESIAQASAKNIVLSCQIRIRQEAIGLGQQFEPQWNGWEAIGDSVRFNAAVSDSIAAMAETKRGDYQTDIDEIAKRGFKRTDSKIFKKYAKAAEDVARLFHKRLYIPNFRNPDYEEAVSIGVLAVMVMLKNKSDAQLEKYNAMYITTAINWAIYNEFRIRYDWFQSIAGLLDEVTEEERAECERLGIDAKQHAVRLAIYDIFRQIYNGVKSGELPPDESRDYFGEFETFMANVEKVKPQLSAECAVFVNEFFDAKTTNESLKSKHSVADVHRYLNELHSALNGIGQKSY